MIKKIKSTPKGISSISLSMAFVGFELSGLATNQLCMAQINELSFVNIKFNFIIMNSALPPILMGKKMVMVRFKNEWNNEDMSKEWVTENPGNLKYENQTGKTIWRKDSLSLSN